MTEHEHHHKITLEESEGPTPVPEKSWTEFVNPIALSVIVAALIIGASVFLGDHMLGKALVKQIAVLQLAGTSGQLQQAAAAPAAAPTGPVTIADRPNEPTMGSSSAKVTMVEFGDFQCPFCKAYFQQTFSDIKTKYVDTGKVRLIFRHFPLTTIHVNAQIAAVAAECANQQGKFWEYHDLLYTNGQSDGTNLDKASLENYANQLGLNNGTFGFGKNKFNNCLESSATLPIVQGDQAEGIKDGVSGTPTFYINGVQLVGAEPTATFEQAIETALAK